jgi:hypothetical protein
MYRHAFVIGLNSASLDVFRENAIDTKVSFALLQGSRRTTSGF